MIEALAESVESAAARIVGERLAAREWICRTLTTLQNLRGTPSNLDVRRFGDVSRQEFVDSYYSANRPLVLKGVTAEWPASTLWTPAYLKAVLGADDVEIMMHRDAVRAADRNVSDAIKRRMKFGDYLDLVYGSTPSNDFYLVTRNKFFDSEAGRRLLDDVRWPEPFIEPDPACRHTYMLLGPAGTVTSLHHDRHNILFIQVLGRKRIRLYSPLYAECMYQREPYYSDVDCENPDTRRFPLFQRARGAVVELEPGDGLFIPVGWWHHVRALTPSLSLGFSSFGLCNEFPYLRNWRLRARA